MNNSFVTGIIQLVRSAMKGHPENLPKDLDFEMVYRFAVKQNVVALLYSGIVNSKVELSPELDKKFFASSAGAIAFFERQQRGLSKIYESFDQNEIDYLPLKGAAIRSLYPQEEFRAMSDIDLLVREEQYEKISAVMKELGYEEKEEWHSVFSWRKNLLHVELHLTPIPTDVEDYHAYYSNGWHLAKKTNEEPFHHKMSDEDCLIYVFVHLAKHYRIAGIGIRQLIDVYVLLGSCSDLDMDYIRKELEKLKLSEFFDNVVKTIKVWFEDGQADETTRLITNKLIGSGAFGTTEVLNQSTAVKAKKKGEVKHTRTNHLFKALFMPYENMCTLFPILKKVPILLPVMWAWRIIYTVAFRHERLSSRIDEMKSLAPNNLSRYEQEMAAVGLNYEVEEGK